MSQSLKVPLMGWRKNHPITFFILSFVLMMAVFYLFYLAEGVQDKYFSPLVHLYAKLSSSILNLIGYKTFVDDATITSAQFSTSIKAGCDAVEAMVIFIAGILAFPSSLQKKGRGLIVGIAIIFIMNVIRIISLFMAGVYSQSLFETLHLIVWQIIFILFPVGLWLLWLRNATRKPRKA